jgi:hypothetical protein
MVIYPNTLARIYEVLGHLTPFGRVSAGLLYEVKMKLFEPIIYDSLFKEGGEFHKNRFIVDNICKAIMSWVIKSLKQPYVTNTKMNWDDARYYISCQHRLDFFSASGIIDLRLTRCRTHDEFLIDIRSRKYHRTAAFVSDGLNKVNYIILGVNKKKYNTFTINMANYPDLMAEGRQEYEDLIDSYLLMSLEDKAKVHAPVAN